MTPKPRTPLPGYCLPIFDRSWSEVPGLIERHAPAYASFELWIDRLRGFDPVTWPALRAQSPRPLIALWNRGPSADATGADPSWIQPLLDELDERDWIDLDSRRQAAAWDLIEEHGCRARRIASAHDYSRTPEEPEIDTIEAELRARSAQIIKLSMHCRDENDALRLLARRLRWKATQGNEGSIIFGMGEAGRITRIFGPLWGNALIYAPSRETTVSAPGQIAREELEIIYQALGQSPPLSPWSTESGDDPR